MRRRERVCIVWLINSCNSIKALEASVKNQELLNTADISLAEVSPRPKCDSYNIYLQKGVYMDSVI